MTMLSILDEVAFEREHQDEKLGIPNHDPSGWCEVLGEEFGEVCRGSMEHRLQGKSIDNYREELIHVAAVAVAAIECLDRRGDKYGS